PEAASPHSNRADAGLQPARHAFTLSVVFTALMALTALLAYIQSVYLNGSGRGLPVLLAETGAGLLAIWLCRRGRHQLGIGLLVVSVLVIPLLALPRIAPGQGLSLAVLTIVLVAGLAPGTLPRRWTLAALVAVSVQATVFVLYDYYGPHAFVQTNYWVVLGVGGVTALVFGYLNRRLFPQAGLRLRLVIAFAIAALLPLVVLAAMNSQRLTNLLYDEAYRELGESTNQSVRAIETFLTNNLDAIRTDARLPDLESFMQDPNGDPAEVLILLQHMVARDPVFLISYGLLDLSGKNLLDTNSYYAGGIESGRPYFEEALRSGLPYVSPVLFYEDQPRLYFSAPIRDSAGSTIGVLRAEYNAAVLQWLLSGLIGSDQHNLYAVLLEDETFLRIAHSSDASLLYKTYAQLDVAQLQNLQVQHRFPLGDIDQISTYQPDVVSGLQNSQNEPFFQSSGVAAGGVTVSTSSKVAETGWTVLTRTPLVSIQRAVDEQTRASIILAMLIAAIAVVYALFVAQVLSAPIVRLTRVAEQVAAGDLQARSPVASQDEIGQLSATFNTMTGRLQETLGGLEQRVAERTRALELSSDVSRRLSNILDVDQLVHEVVELLQAAFNYYHVHIYLYDEARENLVMSGGTGEAGRLLLERGHKIPRGRGLVGRACESGVVVLVPDTTQDPNWLPNPLLPETRAEVAVPILFGDEVVGALDVQQNIVGGLGPQDADLLRGIANQVAIALRNARQYQQAARQARQEMQTAMLIEQIQRTQSVDEALQVTVRELGRALNAPGVRARLLAPADNGHKTPGQDGQDGR
ncbi:MAG: GAF domain-containing protein, partial [Chloroflexota bacterium]